MNNKFSFYKIYAKLADEAYKNKQNGDAIQISNKKYIVLFQRNLSGFSATLYKSKSGENIIAVRGTNLNGINTDSIDDVVNDFLLATIGTNWQNSDLQNFYNDCVSAGLLSSTDKLTVVGHSLGGYFSNIYP